MTKVEEIIAQLETLTPDERAIVADAALASIAEPDPEVMAAWKAEIERRVAMVRNGTATTIPAEDVFRRTRQRLGES